MSTDEKRQDILRKVRALIAKADSTPFEAEADAFRAKAQQLMDAYMIDQWQLAQDDSSKASSLQPIRKDIDISWWYDEDESMQNALWSMFSACTGHCNVVLGIKKMYFDYTNRRPGSTGAYTPAFGTAIDLEFLDMLFTSLMLQMGMKLKPVYDPNLTMGHNIAIAKEAGMKYIDIARWLGRDDWVQAHARREPRWDGGTMLREYKKHVKANGGAVNSANPRTYQMSYALGFAGAIRERLRAMRQSPEGSDNRLALAIRDVHQMAKELRDQTFPDYGVRTTGGSSVVRRGPRIDHVAMAKGGQAGKEARIEGRGGRLGNQRELT